MRPNTKIDREALSGARYPTVKSAGEETAAAPPSTSRAIRRMFGRFGTAHTTRVRFLLVNAVP